MLPSAEELKYFLEICIVLNFSRAAQKLGISQPSLSLAVQRLEKTIGTQLFIRHKQGVTLTQAGKQLLQHARQLLEYWENTKSQTLASQQEIQGYYTLGCHSTIATHIVSNFFASLLETNPKLEIHIKNEISRKITEQVISLSIDIGIVVNPIKYPDLIIKKLCSDEVSFWVGKGNRGIQEMNSNNAVILCDPHLKQTQSLLKKINKLGFNPGRIITMNSLEVVASMAAKGCGIGILPGRVATALYPKLLERIPKTPAHIDEICLIYRNENRHIQAFQTIITAIKKHFST